MTYINIQILIEVIRNNFAILPQRRQIYIGNHCG